jgi:very-short-patch-repair endonuclease
MSEIDTNSRILKLLKNNPKGLAAWQIASMLELDKKQVNSILYKNLSNQVWQNKSYKWFLKNTKEKSAETETLINKPLSDIARLCRYYLACLGQEDAGISTFAKSDYDLDYEELSSLPLSTEELEFEEGYQTLKGRARRDRSKLQMYLGYPTNLRHHKSNKSDWEGYFVEPLFLFAIEIDPSTNSVTIDTSYPIINTKILSAYTNSDRDSLMDELVRLEEELGISGDAESIAIDDMAMRLQSIRTEWPWKEDIIPTDIDTHSKKLSEITETGIFNKAIVVYSEKSPYTSGLESELNELSKCSAESIDGTALGTFLKGNKGISEAEDSISKPLLEVLPMNTEQREAVNSSLRQDLTIITGPPGTGKSQVVTNLLTNVAWQENKKILFASKNNSAVDVVEIRINNLATRPILLRVGSQAYQKKLAQYLLALLSTTSSKDDQLGFEEAERIHQKLLERSDNLDDEVESLIDTRNQVDQLEQELDDIRESYSEEEFQSFKSIDIDKMESGIEDLKALLRSVKKVIFWFFRKNGIYQKANINLSNAIEFLDDLSIVAPSDKLTEGNISQWWSLINDLEALIVDARIVNEYFEALEELTNSKSLEAISLEKSKIIESIASNSEILWTLWLKLQPSKLSHEDRNLLTRYKAILEMVIDTKEGERLERNIFKEYKKASDEISHLLPCWAVTSLSARGKVPFQPGFFDIVVFDEASQCDIASALPLLYRAKAAVVIGDPKQLSHISSLRRGQDQQFLDKFNLLSTHPHWAYSYNSLFGLASGLCSPTSIINLVDHHRSHADIIEFSNKQFYEQRLRVATRYENLNQVDPKEDGVRWVNVQGSAKRAPSGGAINTIEVKAVVDELIKLVLVRGYKGTVGVVSPFRAQANAIDAAVKRNNELDMALINQKFISNTVHKFQGDERDVMIFSPVLSSGMPRTSAYFLQNQGNLFNVAITRARAQLIVVGDLAQCGVSDVGYLAEFAKYSENLKNKKEASIQELNYGSSKYPEVDNPEQVSEWERYFYSVLYSAGIKTIPQYRVEKYALDFAIIDGERMLNIEVDGERYHRNWNGELCRRDQIRNQRMHELGWDVERFWVYEIRDDLESCIQRIKEWRQNG